MLYTSLQYLPHKISCSKSIENEFKIAFSSEESKRAKGIVYFFLSEKPIPRVSGESRILYIGKTSTSLHSRYYRHSRALSSNKNGAFYSHIIEKYGPITFGYFFSEDPRIDEHKYFSEYYERHLEHPPKSKVG
ncbi:MULTISPECIES: hypothetical protein [unclassified Pseudomonas]|uniref:hypothetical protein n=1 Tax=unclassified Pseudomonas TaxID=196821 RepID=UPI001CBF1AB2|nr:MULTISPECIES: hypothetical protein [unclassified Pseudomonas]